MKAYTLRRRTPAGRARWRSPAPPRVGKASRRRGSPPGYCRSTLAAATAARRNRRRHRGRWPGGLFSRSGRLSSLCVGAACCFRQAQAPGPAGWSRYCSSSSALMWRANTLAKLQMPSSPRGSLRSGPCRTAARFEPVSSVTVPAAGDRAGEGLVGRSGAVSAVRRGRAGPRSSVRQARRAQGATG